jgi:hypothetical protein
MLFQSAPRTHARGDNSPANRQSHKALSLSFREQHEFFRPKQNSIFKEPLKVFVSHKVSASRESIKVKSALLVRGRRFIR